MTSRINVVRIITGGSVAGVVLVLVNVLAQFMLSERFQGEVNTWMPGAADRMRMSSASVAIALGMKLVIGIVLVWLYAAARPRFGPGPKTAALIALTVWLLGAVFFSDFALTGMLSWATYALLEALQLLAFLVATWTGAWLYREP